MRLVLILSAFAVLTSPFDFAQGRQLTDGDATRDRLDSYLIAYQPQLSSLVADERMTQRDGISPLALGQSHGPTKNREIISEVASIALPGEVGWLGFRRVTMVNGKKIADAGPSLALLLSDGAKDDYDQARLLLARSAEHNLGFPRTTNLPNLPLDAAAMKTIAAALLGLLLAAQKPAARDVCEQLNAYLAGYEPNLSTLADYSNYRRFETSARIVQQ